MREPRPGSPAAPDRPSPSPKAEPRFDRDAGATFLFAIACAGLAHALLSALGFNLLDDGFVLAQSRRLLDGQLPHRDFITIRPAGSGLLHTFELMVGGDHAFLLSRLVFWLEISLIGWCWVELLRRRSGRPLPFVTAAILIALALMAGSHQFPAMAWHTVDALFLASLGTLALESRRMWIQTAGALLLGAAVVCKQTFLPFVPLALLLAPRGPRLPLMVGALAAPLAYVGWLVSDGGWADLRVQLEVPQNPFHMGLHPFLLQPWHWLGVATGAWCGGALLWARRVESTAPRSAALLRGTAFAATLACITWAASHLTSTGRTYIEGPVFVLSGGAAGLLPAILLMPGGRRLAELLVLTLACAWTVSLSYGYATPALAGGALLVAWLGVQGVLQEPVGGPSALRLRCRLALAGLALACLSWFAPLWWTARHEHVYQDGPARTLTARLDGVVAGAAGIRTNPVTRDVLADLEAATHLTHGRPYAVLLDGAGWWACSEQSNPLPCDWPQHIELRDGPLRTRFRDALVQGRGHLAVLVQKVTLFDLYPAPASVSESDSFYASVRTARSLYQPSASTRYWEVLE